MEFRSEKNDGTLFVVLNQPLAFKASLDLNLPDSLSIFELVDNFFNDVEYDIGNNDLVTYFMFISPLTELWLNMNFTDFKLHVQDDGLVKRYTTMVRRQSKISDFSKGTDAIKTRNQNFDKGFYEEINTECNERSAEATSQIMRYVFDIKFNNLSSDQCIAVTDFLFNKKATIKLESDVNRPFNMYSLINAGDLNKASGRVNLQVYN